MGFGVWSLEFVEVWVTWFCSFFLKAYSIKDYLLFIRNSHSTGYPKVVFSNLATLISPCLRTRDLRE